MATETAGPTVPEIEAARARLDGIARVTPVYSSETFSRLTGRDVLLKAENLQRTGAFKVRGAVNDAGLGNRQAEPRHKRELSGLRGVDRKRVRAIQYRRAAILPVLKERGRVENRMLGLAQEARLRHAAEN